MEDLRLAIALMTLLSIVTFAVTCRVLRRASPIMLDTLAVITLCLIGAYFYLVWGQLWIVNWIPLPSVIVLANWFPILLALLGGILWLRMAASPLWRRLPTQLALAAVTIWSVIYVIPATPPECGNEWIPPEPPIPFPICRQTTDLTCSAAAAATLLTSLGIEATEAEMSKLCLTQSGTTWLGLYHGLSVKLLGTEFRAKFFEGSVEDLTLLASTRPVLLCCQLNEKTAAQVPQYRDAGWIPGVLHSVVCFGRFGDVYLIGDPSQTRMEQWSHRDMLNLWTGIGLTIAVDNDPILKENGIAKPEPALGGFRPAVGKKTHHDDASANDADSVLKKVSELSVGGFAMTVSRLQRSGHLSQRPSSPRSDRAAVWHASTLDRAKSASL